MQHTYNDVLRETTRDYLKQLPGPRLTDPALLEDELLSRFSIAIRGENALRDKAERWSIPQTLPNFVIADILLHEYEICNISYVSGGGDVDNDLLGIYQSSGQDMGIYKSDENSFKRIIRRYKYNATSKDMSEIMAILKEGAERIRPNTDRDLIAVNNGIFNYRTKQLMDFDPRIVFIAKCRVDYDSNAKNVTRINPDGSTWDVESWMQTLSDDPEIVSLLWCILGAIIRPNVSWNTAVWLYAKSGNNGKGTLCELMRELCGDGSYATLSLSDFSKDFMLEQLIGAVANIVDENNVGTFIDKAANFKIAVTGDMLMINRKHKSPVNYRFRGLQVFCVNEHPRVRDKSDSFLRRIRIVPFEKCFTGKENTEIKDVYIKDHEVLKYILFKVLNMNYYTIPDPKACQDELHVYREFNDPVLQFMNDILPDLVWDLVPYTFLYDLYKAWAKRTSPSSIILGRNSFIGDVKELIQQFPEWIGSSKNVRTRGRISEPEYLIAEYDLKEWMNPRYIASSNMDAKCMPVLNEQYTGLLRLSSVAPDE